MMTSQVFSGKVIADLMLDAYDDPNSKRVSNPYELGMLVGKQQGINFINYIQTSAASISNHVSEILLELFNPDMTNRHEDYIYTKNSYFIQFLSGAVRAKP